MSSLSLMEAVRDPRRDFSHEAPWETHERRRPAARVFVGHRFVMRRPPVACYRFFSFASNTGLLARMVRLSPVLLAEDAVRPNAISWPLLWLDLAKGRLRLDRLRRNGGDATFFP